MSRRKPEDLNEGMIQGLQAPTRPALTSSVFSGDDDPDASSKKKKKRKSSKKKSNKSKHHQQMEKGDRLELAPPIYIDGEENEAFMESKKSPKKHKKMKNSNKSSKKKDKYPSEEGNGFDQQPKHHGEEKIETKKKKTHGCTKSSVTLDPHRHEGSVVEDDDDVEAQQTQQVHCLEDDVHSSFISQKQRHRKMSKKTHQKANHGTKKETRRMNMTDNRSFLATPRTDLDSSGDDDSVMDHPGAIPVRGFGRRAIESSNADATIVYSMGASSSNDETIEGGSNDDDFASSRQDESNEHLVVAELAPALEIAECTPMEENGTQQPQPQQQPWHKTWSSYLLVAIMFAVVAVSVLLIVLLPSKQESTFAPTTSPKTSPTTAPTTSPTTSPTTAATTAPSTAPPQSNMDMAVEMLSPYIPDLPNGPTQQQALDWLIENDGEGLVATGNADRLLDRFVLAVLFFATFGEYWAESVGWLSKASVCNWYSVDGFICPRDGDRVDRIYLRGNNLQGTLPTELGTLTALTLLRLDSNALHGMLPAELGYLTALTYLGLHSNVLHGTIPAQLVYLKALRHLDLGSNDLILTIPTELGLASSLTHLDLSYNPLAGSIPTEFGSLRALTYLKLNDSDLRGAISTELGLVSSLEVLDLSWNDIVQTIPSELGSLVALTDLDLARNDLSGNVPTELESILSSLTEYGCAMGCNEGLIGIPDNCLSCY